MLIRLAEPAEYDEIGAVTVAAYGSFLVGPADPYADRLRDAAGRAAVADLWVAVGEDGSVLGSVTDPPPGSPYRELGGPDEAEFRMLAVAPSARGRGVGEALVRHVVDRARAAGMRAVKISTLAEMDAAHRLYARFGFRWAPDLDWEPIPGVRLLAMQLDLEAPT